MVEQIVNFSEPRERAAFISQTNALVGSHRVTFVKYRKRRTDAQNRYYRGVIVECLRGYLRDQGDMYTNEKAHKYLAKKFLLEPVIHAETGEVIEEIVRSTKELSVNEFCEFIELCIAHLADFFHIVVPAPEWNRSEVASRGH